MSSRRLSLLASAVATALLYGAFSGFPDDLPIPIAMA